MNDANKYTLFQKGIQAFSLVEPKENKPQQNIAFTHKELRDQRYRSI